EDSRSLDWLFCLLFVTRLFDPFIRCERRGRCKADTITIIFGFVEQVESAILVYDITIYAGFSILWSEQHFWLSFQIGKTFICIRIINNIWPVTMFHRPVHHIFPCGRIVYGLRGPNTFQILLSSILLLDIDDVGRPINQILGLYQYHCTVRVPALRGSHVSEDHVESFAILGTEDMRITDPASRTDFLGIQHRLIAVQSQIIVTVLTD